MNLLFRIALRNLKIGDIELTPDDETNIDKNVIEFVSQRLNDDWEQLATKLLDDKTVRKIDLDNRTVYDKCRAMFHEWKFYPVSPTKAMLKLHLQNIPRNDILLDLSKGILSLLVQGIDLEIHVTFAILRLISVTAHSIKLTI